MSHSPSAQPLALLTIDAFLQSLAAKTPSPGGGAVAGAVGAIAVSTARMVLAYSIGKKSLAQHEETLKSADAALTNFSRIFLHLADEDTQAYAWINELQRLPETDPRRQREWSDASTAALGVPRACLAAAGDLLRLLQTLPPKTNKFLHSDLAISAILAHAAARSAWWNVKVNLSLVTAADQRSHIESECATILNGASARAAEIESACMA